MAVLKSTDCSATDLGHSESICSVTNWSTIYFMEQWKWSTDFGATITTNAWRVQAFAAPSPPRLLQSTRNRRKTRTTRTKATSATIATTTTTVTTRKIKNGNSKTASSSSSKCLVPMPRGPGTGGHSAFCGSPQQGEAIFAVESWQSWFDSLLDRNDSTKLPTCKGSTHTHTYTYMYI